MKNIIMLKNISKTYDKNRWVLHNINFEVNEGDFIVITGESGCGKSTLINILGLLDNNYSGDYFLESLNVNELTDNALSKIRNKKIGYIFQDYKLIITLTNKENILLPYKYSKNKPNYEYFEEITKLLKVDKMLGSYPDEISGGEQQRIAIARSLIMKPQVILADEPTAALDSINEDIIYDLFLTLNKQGHTIIVVTHNLDNIKYSNKHIYLRGTASE